jgi:hypothetical protein
MRHKPAWLGRISRPQPQPTMKIGGKLIHSGRFSNNYQTKEIQYVL